MPDRAPSPAPRNDAADQEQAQEIQRLRNLLIERDTELGTARGRLAELEAHPLQPAIVARYLLSRFPRLTGFAAAVLRRLRGGRGRTG